MGCVAQLNKCRTSGQVSGITTSRVQVSCNATSIDVVGCGDGSRMSSNFGKGVVLAEL